MLIDEQLSKWVAGESIHNEERGECCPDFSCCRPELIAPVEIRKMFAKAWLEDNEEIKSRLLGEFLSNLLENYKPKVHIVGLETSRREVEVDCNDAKS